MTHTNSFACTFDGCKKRFRIQFDLDVHLRKHRGENPFACGECDEVFTSKPDLKAHYRKHKGKSDHEGRGRGGEMSPALLTFPPVAHLLISPSSLRQ